MEHEAAFPGFSPHSEGEVDPAFEAIERLKLTPVVRHGLEVIEQHTPPSVEFHNLEHSEEVVDIAVRLAIADGIADARELELVAIAAAYHDIGYITGKTPDHEERGCDIVAIQMESAGYSGEEIRRVQAMIRSTKIELEQGILVQKASDEPLARYVQDADLANFGMTTFFQRRTSLQKDLGVADSKAFMEETYRFVEHHRWRSEPARQAYEAQERENLRQLAANIAAA